MEKNFIITLIAAISVVIVLVLFLVFASMGADNKVVKKSKKKQKKEDKSKTSIEELVEIAANRNSTKNQLNNAVIKLTRELSIPKKTHGNMPKEAKIYLNFILLVASHKNADAKLIAFMNTELKKANKEYGTEIDIYENEGLLQRINRV